MAHNFFSDQAEDNLNNLTAFQAAITSATAAMTAALSPYSSDPENLAARLEEAVAAAVADDIAEMSRNCDEHNLAEDALLNRADEDRE